MYYLADFGFLPISDKALEKRRNIILAPDAYIQGAKTPENIATRTQIADKLRSGKIYPYINRKRNKIAKNNVFSDQVRNLNDALSDKRNLINPDFKVRKVGDYGFQSKIKGLKPKIKNIISSPLGSTILPTVGIGLAAVGLSKLFNRNKTNNQ